MCCSVCGCYSVVVAWPQWREWLFICTLGFLASSELWQLCFLEPKLDRLRCSLPALPWYFMALARSVYPSAMLREGGESIEEVFFHVTVKESFDITNETMRDSMAEGGTNQFTLNGGPVPHSDTLFFVSMPSLLQ